MSTPLQNYAYEGSGKMDTHSTALWAGGHIKFWSRRTIRGLFGKAGFDEIGIYRVGRVFVLAKSMISVFRKRDVPPANA